jgi:hypothetical protein
LFYPPIITVGEPRIIVPPCAVGSPILAAGIFPIITVDEPLMMVSMGPVHIHISPTRAAVIPPIVTVVHPGGITGPPTCGTGPVNIGQVCMSVILAADGITFII